MGRAVAVAVGIGATVGWAGTAVGIAVGATVGATVGGGTALAPGADSADGHFDVITVGDVGRWEALTQIALKLADGSYLSNPKTTRRKAFRLAIDTDDFVLADVDGENLGKLPMRIEMLPFRIGVAVL